MTIHELVAKQQLEIEELKETISAYEESCKEAISALNHPEQWSIKCHDFPRIAMVGILRARRAIEDIPKHNS